MGDSRVGEISDSTPSTIKSDTVRSIQGGALLRTIPGQARFMMTAPGQSTTALISTTTTIQNQVLPKATGQVGSTGIGRINTIPVQATTTTGYHVPRGAAAVANISLPRSSIATPIVRAPTTLQTIGVAQHALPPSANCGRPVVTCLQGQSRPSQIPVGARLVSSHQMRPIGDVQARPVLVHTGSTTHKQVTLTQQTQVQMGGPVKSYSNSTRHPNAPSLSRITASRPQGLVSIPATVLLPTQPNKQLQHKVISQQSHGNSSVQIPTVATSTVPQTISIGAVNRPVMIGTTPSISPIRPVPKGIVGTSDVGQQLYIQGPKSTILVREPARHNKESEPPTLSITSSNSSASASSVNSLYPLPVPGSGFFEGGAPSSRPLVTLAPARTNQGAPSSTQQMVLNSVMVVEQPRIHTLVPSTSESSQGIISSTSESIGVSTCGSGIPVLLPKQVTSPRPSILRKRDPDGLITSAISISKKHRLPQMKVQKNLTPLLSSMSSNSPPRLPPSPPPKRPESSSGGSTTVSANSSPGESPHAPMPSIKEDEEQLQLPVQCHPIEVSPRKKPRKQQLSGNQISEPTFSEDEMEFISEDKIKKENKEGDVEAKPILKRKSMSLLSSYKNQWKPRYNHFLRYTDVKVKEEKVPSLSELANQKNALQRIEGWKILHLSSQMDTLLSGENEFVDFFNSLLKKIPTNRIKNKDMVDDYNRINERVKANFQRTVVSKDQVFDAKEQMIKLLDHKNYISEILQKNISRRGNKKRERL